MSPDTGTLIISLDFELVWGVLDFIESDEKKKFLATRKIVPALLELFKEHQIHATWAAVGFLFFESRSDLFASLPEKKPSYTDRSLSPYDYVNTVGENENDDPLHFAPSLIRQILDMPNQELATHTFSHYYCLEDGQTPEEFEYDLKEALKIAEKYGHKFESIIFPRNQYTPAYLNVCATNGLMAYRGNEALWFRRGQPRRVYRQWPRRIARLMDAYLNLSGSNAYPLPPKDTLPLNFPSSRYLRPYSKRLQALEPLRLRRVLSAMTHAARTGQVFHIWWHPEDFRNHVDENLAFLKSILTQYDELHHLYGMQSRNIREVTRLVLDRED